VTSGITAGSDWLDIFGTFERGVTVTIGGQPAIIMSDRSTIFVLPPPSPAGVADLVVTNPNGRSVTLPDAFTYTRRIAAISMGSGQEMPASTATCRSGSRSSTTP
jgi:hypothetical protein